MNEPKAKLKDRLKEALVIREKRAVDLVKDLKIPKSAISQYLSGKSEKMDSERLYNICKYLNVNEPWLLGYDVPMEQRNNDNDIEFDNIKLELFFGKEGAAEVNELATILKRINKDEGFRNLMININKLNPDELENITVFVNALVQKKGL